MERGSPVWPKAWPKPEVFWEPLADQVVSIHTRSLLIGLQIIVRFHNGFGATILTDRLKEGLAEVAVLRFSGPGITDFDYVHDGPVPDLSWCYNPEEIISLCEQISRLKGESVGKADNKERDLIFPVELLFNNKAFSS